MVVVIENMGVRDEGGGQAEGHCPHNNLNLEKFGKFLSNYTKIRVIFAEISEKMGNLNPSVCQFLVKSPSRSSPKLFVLYVYDRK